MSIKFIDKRILFHSVYIFGLTFFSTLGANFIDQLITNQELFVSLMTGFISMGIAYFTNMMIRSKIDDNIIKPRTKPSNLNCINTISLYSGFWGSIYLMVYPPIFSGVTV